MEVRVHLTDRLERRRHRRAHHVVGLMAELAARRRRADRYRDHHLRGLLRPAPRARRRACLRRWRSRRRRVSRSCPSGPPAAGRPGRPARGGVSSSVSRSIVVLQRLVADAQAAHQVVVDAPGRHRWPARPSRAPPTAARRACEPGTRPAVRAARPRPPSRPGRRRAPGRAPAGRLCRDRPPTPAPGPGRLRGGPGTFGAHSACESTPSAHESFSLSGTLLAYDGQSNCASTPNHSAVGE